jgi:hypothetical protein
MLEFPDARIAVLLHTYRDGARILPTILRLFQSERPLAFYGIGFLLCASLETYSQTGLVPRLPTAVLCTSIMLTVNR